MRERALYGALFVSGMLAFAASAVRLHELLPTPPLPAVTQMRAPAGPVADRSPPVRTESLVSPADGPVAVVPASPTGGAAAVASVPGPGSARADEFARDSARAPIPDLEPVQPAPGSQSWPPSPPVGGPFVAAPPAPAEPVQQPAVASAGEPAPAAPPSVPPEPVATVPVPPASAPTAVDRPAAGPAAGRVEPTVPPPAVAARSDTGAVVPPRNGTVAPPVAGPRPRIEIRPTAAQPAEPRRHARAGILVVRGAPPLGARAHEVLRQPGARIVPVAPPAAR